MRKSVVACAAVLVWSGALLFAQAQKVTTPEELDKVMKRVGPAMQATGKAVASAAYADARTQLATAKAALTEASTFWATHKKEDAQKFSADALAKLEALDKALAAPTVDAAAVTAAQRELQGACRTCHMAYRVQDQATGAYSLKPGSIGGN